ncbi:alpha-L-fucosidase [Aestuariimicrobium soli]|uniref:alpha-L-fucosidase n=1 Tax=Aestuariimicrobium soli TaxID=2035834 RepID=UPI003EB8790C
MTSSLPPLRVDDLPDPVDVSDNTEALAGVRRVIDAGPYTDSWESLKSYQPPTWYEDAKFGIFIHWGLYSVPAFGSEWYSRSMYCEGSREHQHHIETYGSPAEFGYKDFIPSFTMHDFDPQQWATLFREAGAQFVVPVAEHHDGFAMYDTARSRWSAARMGPERDVFGELTAAVDQAWMVPGASSHRAEHWFFMNGGTKTPSDVLDPATHDFYGPAQREETVPSARFLEDWLLRTVEIIDRYRPQVLWFDWWIEQPAFKPSLAKLAAYYYNRAAEWGREVVINFKWGAFEPGTAVYDIERGAMGEIQPVVWQNDTSVSKTAWGWVEGHEYKSADDLVCELADVVSKNGVLLLNIGPKPDGTIADQEQRLLREIGAWLSRNGEAIYGTRPWVISGEGPTEVVAGSFVDGHDRVFTGSDLRFTSRSHVTGRYVYAIPLGDPTDGLVRIRSFGKRAGLLTDPIAEVTLLGEDEAPRWEQTADELVVHTKGRAVVKLFLRARETPPRTDFLH